MPAVRSRSAGRQGFGSRAARERARVMTRRDGRHEKHLAHDDIRDRRSSAAGDEPDAGLRALSVSAPHARFLAQPAMQFACLPWRAIRSGRRRELLLPRFLQPALIAWIFLRGRRHGQCWRCGHAQRAAKQRDEQPGHREPPSPTQRAHGQLRQSMCCDHDDRDAGPKSGRASLSGHRLSVPGSLGNFSFRRILLGRHSSWGSKSHEARTGCREIASDGGGGNAEGQHHVARTRAGSAAAQGAALQRPGPIPALANLVIAGTGLTR